MTKRESKDILHEYLIRSKIFGKYTYTGRGSNWFTYLLEKSNEIVKITSDQKEIESALYFQDYKSDYIVDYIDILQEEEYGIIRMERIYPLNIYNENHFHLIKKWIHLVDPDTTEIFTNREEKYRNDILNLMDEFDLDLMELHWGNCGFDSTGNIKFFDLRVK